MLRRSAATETGAGGVVKKRLVLIVLAYFLFYATPARFFGTSKNLCSDD